MQTKIKYKMTNREKRENRWGILFSLPCILGFLIFALLPMAVSLGLSFTNFNFTTGGQFIGISNYKNLFSGSDPYFYKSLLVTVIYVALSVPTAIIFSFFIAMLLNTNVKGKGFFRLIFFLPVIIVSGPILGMLNAQGAGSITSIDTQAITEAIKGFLPTALATPISELFENMVTILWYSGVQILIFLSALQKIDRAMYEAAKIDGGSGWECFWKITLPNIKPMILLNLVYTIVFISNNDQNSIIGLIKDAMFSGTEEKGYGYASAMAWLYSLVVLLIVGLFSLAFFAKKDVYEKQVKRAKKAHKKEQRQLKKIERRSARNAKKNAKAAA